MLVPQGIGDEVEQQPGIVGAVAALGRGDPHVAPGLEALVVVGGAIEDRMEIPSFLRERLTVADNLQDQLALVAKVRVDRALGQAGLQCHVVERSARNTTGGEDAFSCRQQPQSVVLLLPIAGHPCHGLQCKAEHPLERDPSH